MEDKVDKEQNNTNDDYKQNDYDNEQKITVVKIKLKLNMNVMNIM